MCSVSYSAGTGSVCLNGKLSVAEGNEEKEKRKGMEGQRVSAIPGCATSSRIC